MGPKEAIAIPQTSFNSHKWLHDIHIHAQTQIHGRVAAHSGIYKCPHGRLGKYKYWLATTGQIFLFTISSIGSLGLTHTQDVYLSCETTPQDR